MLPKRLRAALRKLNPTLPTEALDEAFRKVTVPQHPSLIANNRAFHRMLVDGIAVECRRKDDSIGAEIVRLVDFDDPDVNDLLVVNQFTVIEDQHNRRPDVVLFANGFPLPPLAEQQRIVAKVDELMHWCDALEARLTAAQTTATHLIDATLHQILTA